MISIADYLVGRHLPPPPPLGIGRVHYAFDPAVEHDPDEPLYTCPRCGEEKPADAWYWLKRKGGGLRRSAHCRACHIKHVCESKRRRTAARRAAK